MENKENKCKYCEKRLEWELQEVCHECVEKRNGPFRKYIYHTNLSYVPKPNKDGESSTN